MRRHSGLSGLIAAALLVSVPGAARAQDEANATAYATTALRVREAPSTDAAVVGTIPRGSAVAVGACSAEWCEVTTGAFEGHAARRYLTTEPASTRYRIGYRAPSRARGVSTGSGRGYTNSAGVHVQSPTFTQDGRAPEGASARCRDGSFSFSMSRRGTCSHHGGVARWL